MTGRVELDDEMANNLVATGALFVAIDSPEVKAELDGTNHLTVRFSFLKSPYRVTVERITEVVG